MLHYNVAPKLCNKMPLVDPSRFKYPSPLGQGKSLNWKNLCTGMIIYGTCENLVRAWESCRIFGTCSGAAGELQPVKAKAKATWTLRAGIAEAFQRPRRLRWSRDFHIPTHFEQNTDALQFSPSWNCMIFSMNTQCFHFLNLLKIEPHVLPMYLSLKLRTCDARERVERWTCRARRYSCSETPFTAELTISGVSIEAQLWNLTNSMRLIVYISRLNFLLQKWQNFLQLLLVARLKTRRIAEYESRVAPECERPVDSCIPRCMGRVRLT